MSWLITVAALVAAAGFAAIAWRAVREARERSAARVAALAQVIEDVPPGPAAVAGVDRMFDTSRSARVQSRPLLKVGVGFAMTVIVIIAAAMIGDRRETAEDPAARRAPAAQAASLELLSMRHIRQGDTLTVTGLVRNGGAAPAERLTAVVFAFDRDGGFVTSGRAPLEFAVIGAGDESPFRVTISPSTDVARYRVSFRTDSGVVRHVDRRGAPSPASEPAQLSRNPGPVVRPAGA